MVDADHCWRDVGPSQPHTLCQADRHTHSQGPRLLNARACGPRVTAGANRVALRTHSRASRLYSTRIKQTAFAAVQRQRRGETARHSPWCEGYRGSGVPDIPGWVFAGKNRSIVLNSHTTTRRDLRSTGTAGARVNLVSNRCARLASRWQQSKVESRRRVDVWVARLAWPPRLPQLRAQRRLRSPPPQNPQASRTDAWHRRCSGSPAARRHCFGRPPVARASACAEVAAAESVLAGAAARQSCPSPAPDRLALLFYFLDCLSDGS